MITDLICYITRSISKKNPNGPSNSGPGSGGVCACQVEQAELKYISAAREAKQQPVVCSPGLKSQPNPVIGLALSGGGIRAATFHLGVLQALASTKRLHFIDYLSAVSGGSFIAGWLAAWISRSGIDGVTTKLNHKPFVPESREINRLREHRHYLAPQKGGNIFHLASMYVRRAILNLLIIVFALSAIFLLPRAYMCLMNQVFADNNLLKWMEAIGGALAIFIALEVLIAFILADSSIDLSLRVAAGIAFALASFIAVCVLNAYDYFPEWRSSLWLATIPIAIAPLPRFDSAHTLISRKHFRYLYVLIPSLFSSLAIATALFAQAARETYQGSSGIDVIITNIFDRYPFSATIISIVCVGLCVWSLGQRNITWFFRTFPDEYIAMIKIVGLIAIYAGFTVFFFHRGYRLIGIMHENITQVGRLFPCSRNDASHIYYLELCALWIPTFVIVSTLAINVLLTLLGRLFTATARNEMDTISSIIYRTCFVWYFVGFIGLYAPYYINQFGIMIYGWIVVGILVSTILGFRSMFVVTPRKPYISALQDVGTTVAPFVMVVGICICISAMLSSWVMHKDIVAVYYEYLRNVYNNSMTATLGFISAFAILAQLFALRAGLNKVSMHTFYKDRISQAYLDEDERFQPLQKRKAENIRINDLCEKAEYKDGPYLIINSSLNTIGTEDLSLQDRRANNFIFTPLYSGYQVKNDVAGDKGLNKSGYCSTKEYYEKGIELAAVMAISGSAIGTNMGRYTSANMRMLCSLLNLRMAVWFSNPRHSFSWRNETAMAGLNLWMHEIAGDLNDLGPFVYLSDGGHFENTGLYELIRRRCKVIIVSDASADGGQTYSSLGSAIERVRTDFHVEIRFGENMWLGKKLVQYGVIQYGETCAADDIGIIVYIKAGLSEAEPVDLLSYKTVHNSFPHDATFNQWFTESQFESYRKLGYERGKEFSQMIDGANSYAEIVKALVLKASNGSATAKAASTRSYCC